jgi:hypothetical protein
MSRTTPNAYTTRPSRPRIVSRALPWVCLLMACTPGGPGGDKPAADPAGSDRPPAEASTLDCPEGTERATDLEARAAFCARPDGTQHGPFISWHESGQLRHRGHVAEGARQGEWRSFEPDGSAYAVHRYRDGRMHGHQVWLWPSGDVRSEAHYEDGRYHGAHINYNRDGTRAEQSDYVHGERVLHITYEDGEEASRSVWEPWTPEGPAVTRTHPQIPAAWQRCREDHACVLVTTGCCPCGAEDHVAIHHHHEDEARRRVQADCQDVICPPAKCPRVGGRCDDSACVTAH